MSKVATITVPLNNSLRETITRQILCRELRYTLYDKITEYNKKIAISVESENAAVNLVDFFTLAECLKNSLDSGSTELTISLEITIENAIKTVKIILSDNGKGIENPMQLYPYEQAFLSISEKQNERTKNRDKDAPKILGGAGKGLAMSSQFIAFNGGSLSIGKSSLYPHGFEVCITAPNEIATIKWDTYIMEFEKEFSNKIRYMREDRPFSPHSPIRETEDLCSPTKEIEDTFKQLLLLSPTSPRFFTSPVAATTQGEKFPGANLIIQIPYEEEFAFRVTELQK